MYIDILPNDNLDQAVMATFKETGDPKSVQRIRLHLKGTWQWCAITGWEDDEPATAVVTPIEESGDGPALLVTGGAQGLRVALLSDQGGQIPEWDVDNEDQWGEGFLICRPDLQFSS